LQGVIGALAAQVLASHPAQFLVNLRQKIFQCLLVAGAPSRDQIVGSLVFHSHAPGVNRCRAAVYPCTVSPESQAIAMRNCRSALRVSRSRWVFKRPGLQPSTRFFAERTGGPQTFQGAA
jgi:hypothetical protein